MKKYQSQIVIEKLLKDGKVSRNYCLKLGITRLGSIINSLIAEGWKFDDTRSSKGKEIMRGKYVRGDYFYYVIGKPKGI